MFSKTFTHKNNVFNCTIETPDDKLELTISINGVASILKHKMLNDDTIIAEGTVSYPYDKKLKTYKEIFTLGLKEADYLDQIETNIKNLNKGINPIWIKRPSRANFNAETAKLNKVIAKTYKSAFEQIKNKNIPKLEKVKEITNIVKSVVDNQDQNVLLNISNLAAYDLGLPANYSELI